MDLEGLYIYRGDRIIHFGSWNGLLKRSSNLKLARLRVDVGNLNDDLLQLNVAKSKITIPFELIEGVVDYCKEVRSKAVLELNRRGLKKMHQKERKMVMNYWRKSSLQIMVLFIK